MDRCYCPYCMSPVAEGEPCPVCGLTAGTYVPSSHHLPPGTMLKDRYLIGRVLGEGGFGITYVGQDLTLERKVAVKEYYPKDRSIRNAAASIEVSSFMGAAEEGYKRGMKRFLQEAKVMALMDKQHTMVQVQDFFEANNTAYIVMEYVEGITLKERMEQLGGRIDPEELFPTVEPLFRALSALHNSGLVHRDISPDNLMLENGHIRLLDFGCARESANGNETMTIVLKHGYAPFEQYMTANKQGPWTDIYSLSATLYHCLTGRKPPAAPERTEEDELALPSQLGVALTKQEEQALMKGLAVFAGDRFQTMEELHAALYKEEPAAFPLRPKSVKPAPVEPAEALEPAEPVGTEPPASWLRRHWPIAAGAVAVLALVAVLAALPRNKPEPKPSPESPAPAVTVRPIAEPAATEEPIPAWRVAPGEQPDPGLFADAYTLKREECSRERLAELMDDDAVSAVILPRGAGLNLNTEEGEFFTVSKPLLVEPGAELWANALTVSREGFLQVDGRLYCYGLIRLEGRGGCLVLNGMAYETENHVVILMDEEENLILSDENVREAMGNHLQIMPHRPADMVSVTNLEELRKAEGVRSPISIDADLVIPKDNGYDLISPLVWVGEGVTLSNTDGAWGRLGLSADTVLVNEGEIRCELGVGERAVVYNYGTVGAPLNGLNLCGETDALFVNFGTLNANSNGELREGSQLTNLGTVNAYSLDLVGGTLCNLRQLNLPTDSNLYNAVYGMQRGRSSMIYNSGTVTVWPAAILWGGGWLVNDGLFSLGRNADIGGGVYNRTGTVQVADIVNYDVVNVCLDNYEANFLPASGTYQAADYPFTGLWQVPHRGVVVHSEEELLEKADGDVPLVVEKDGFTITQDVELKAPLYINGTLTVAENARLTMNGAMLVLCNSGKLTAAQLTMEDGDLYVGDDAVLDLSGGMLYMHNAVTYSEGGTLKLDGAQIDILHSFLTMGQADVSMDGAEIRMADGASRFVTPNRGLFSAEGADWDIRGGRLIFSDETELKACRITVDGQDGEEAGVRTWGESLVLRDCTVDVKNGSMWPYYASVELLGDTVLTVGAGSVLGFEDFRWLNSLTSEGRIVNYGSVYINVPAKLAQPIENYGQVYSDRLLVSQVTGNEVLPLSEW